MNKNTKKIFFLVIGIWLLCSNTFMGWAFNQRKGIKINQDIDLPQEGLLPVVFSIDEIRKADDIFESVQISGWGVCPGTKGEPEQKISILLQNDKKNYEIDTEPIGRVAIKSTLRDWGINITGDYHGFSSNFCPSFIRDGQYHVQIICREDNKIVGVEATKFILKKNNGEITVDSELSSQIKNLNLAGAEPVKLKWSVDYVGQENEYFVIRGWILPDEKNFQTATKIVSIMEDTGQYKIYSVNSFPRTDLLQFADIQSCKNAGFEVKIPFNNIRKDAKLKIDFYIQDENRIYQLDDSVFWTQE